MEVSFLGRFSRLKTSTYTRAFTVVETRTYKLHVFDSFADHSKGADKSGKRKSSEDSTEKPDKTKKRKKKSR